MLPLVTQFEDSKFRYTQLSREENVAIFTQEHKPSGILRYEVVRIRIQKEHTWPTGLVTPEKEAYPGANAWGRDGWTFFHLPDAQAHMASLLQGLVSDVEAEEVEAEEEEDASPDVDQ